MHVGRDLREEEDETDAAADVRDERGAHVLGV